MTNQLHALIITDDNPLTMEIAGSPALKHWAELLKPYCNKISLGLKMGQNFNEGKNYTPEIKVIYNEMEELQALGMLHTAMKNNHQDSFMILAMDQIHLSKDLIEFLRKRRNSKKKITAFLGDYFFSFSSRYRILFLFCS